MKTKNFLAAGIVAGIVNFLLGWVFYDLLFPDLFPQQGEPNMVFIGLGCLIFGLLLSYVFTALASITSAKEGLTKGAVFGLLYGVSMNLFMYSSMEPNYQNMAVDVAINVITVAILGAIIAMINGKME